MSLETNMCAGREAVFLRDRVDVLKMRLLAVKSKQCASKKNKYHCPEVFLDAVADKLTTTADLFLDAELLSKFYYIVRCCLRILLAVMLTISSSHVNLTHGWDEDFPKPRSTASHVKTRRSVATWTLYGERSSWSMS